MNLEQRRLIKKYLDILLRGKKIIIIFLLLGIAGGLGMYLRMPKIYKCSALIKYQRQSVNPSSMSPDDIRTRTRDVVDTISQQIMSRTSIEGIIKEFDMFTTLRKNIPMEDVVDIMRRQIHTRLLQGGDVFEVSYQGRSPKKVLKVTNALAAKFIEENLRFRQEKASQTSTYISDELEMAKTALDKKEQLMRDYKLQYYNEMPEQLVNNTNRLIALQDQYQNNQESALELERTRLQVQDQISQRKALSAELSAVTDETTSPSTAGRINDIYQVRLKLQSLQTRYTEKHPEVKRLKKILRELEAQQTDSSGEYTVMEFDPQVEELKQQMRDLEFNINRLNDERKVLEQQIKKYEKWIAAAPVREAEWSALTRDYDQLNAYYERLVTQSLQADSAQSLENQLRGSQFKIIDPAHLPEKPFKPNLMKILLLTVGLGLAAGGGLSFFIESLSTSFKDPTELEDFLNVPVVCAVPTIYLKRELVKRRVIHFALNSILLLAGGAILSVAVYFWKQGMIIL
jgi:polysaccharide chain length determinant protein (PEP-CTERM system associated)